MKSIIITALVLIASLSATAQSYGIISLNPYPSECLVVYGAPLGEFKESLQGDGEIMFSPRIEEVAWAHLGVSTYVARIGEDHDYRYIMVLNSMNTQGIDVVPQAEIMTKRIISWVMQDYPYLYKRTLDLFHSMKDEVLSEVMFIITYDE